MGKNVVYSKDTHICELLTFIHTLCKGKSRDFQVPRDFEKPRNFENPGILKNPGILRNPVILKTP